MTFSPDGKTLATISDDIRLWDVQTGKEMQRLEQADPVAFSPDGKTLATGSR